MSPNPQRGGDPLTACGVTPPESALLNAVHYGVLADPADLPGHVAGRDYSLGGPTTVEDCRTAQAACLAKGWLRVIDEAALRAITDDLRAGGVLGPIYRLPAAGVVDFTPAGAALWERLSDRLRGGTPRPPFAYTDVVRSKTTRYFRSKAVASAAAVEIRGRDGVVTVSEPLPLGPWRVQWWRRYPSGYSVAVESRHRWQGRCAEGEGWFLRRSPRWRIAPGRLRRLLDCHNVTVGEWLLLAAMDRFEYRPPRHLPLWAARSAEEHFGMAAGEEACRAALDACLRYGWLRVVDRGAVDEVNGMLANDPAVSVLSAEGEARPGQVDFTPYGATLYRMIAAEYAGPDWEDDLEVWKERYREEHRYCETEAVVGVALRGYTAKGEVFRASRAVPIGPWCVYWWERFARGYRLELEFGEP